MKKITVLTAFLLLAGSAYCAQGTEPDIKALLEKTDNLFRSKTSFTVMEMQVVTPEWARTMSMKVWTEKMDKTFIYVTAPVKDEGSATLRKNREMWNYLPKINKVMKIPPSMMMSNWMGSDFTNDDLVKESTLIKDYDAVFFTPQKPESVYYYIKLTPKPEAVSVWGRIELILNKEDSLPVKELYYDEHGECMRELDFSDVKTLGGKKIPARLEMRPLNKQGHKTVIIYADAAFDLNLPEDVFTLRNLQKSR